MCFPIYISLMIIDAKDFQEITDSALRSFEDQVGAADPDVCGEFDIAVARLESQVIQLYGIAALLARREPDIEKVGEIWGAMVGVCDAVAKKIKALCDEHPLCTTSHDKILDIRNKCARLSELHS